MTDTHSPDTAPGALSVEDFCERFGVRKTYVYGELKTGRLNAVKAGRRSLIPLAEADRWFRSLPSFRPAQAA